MNCPECQRKSRVLWTKRGIDPDGWTVWNRWRRCVSCSHKFATYECYEYADVEVVFRAQEALTALESGDVAGAKTILASINQYKASTA